MYDLPQPLNITRRSPDDCTRVLYASGAPFIHLSLICIGLQSTNRPTVIISKLIGDNYFFVGIDVWRRI